MESILITSNTNCFRLSLYNVNVNIHDNKKISFMTSTRMFIVVAFHINVSQLGHKIIAMLKKYLDNDDTPEWNETKYNLILSIAYKKTNCLSQFVT